jgi:hypothetical protein
MKRYERYLRERDREILSFVARHRATTPEMVEELCFSETRAQRANAARVLRRLIRRRLLRKVPYAPMRSYLVITRRGLRLLGLPDRSPRPLTEQSLPVVLAIAWFCVRHKVERLTNREFRETYPELWRPALRSSNYYLTDSPDGLKLGLILVDRGGTARRIRTKIRRIIAQRSSLPHFLVLIKHHHFRLTVLTGLPAQERCIRRHLRRGSFHGVAVDTAVIPELGELLILK